MADQEGWVLYYSAEGYPYYYNHVTGESQWAQLGTTVEQYTDFQASAPKDGVRWVDQHQYQYQHQSQQRQLSHHDGQLYYPPQPPHIEEEIGEEEIDQSEESDGTNDSQESEEDDDDDDDDEDDEDDEEERRSSVENKRWRAFLVRRITCDMDLLLFESHNEFYFFLAGNTRGTASSAGKYIIAIFPFT